jgi:hypothetical protein
MSATLGVETRELCVERREYLGDRLRCAYTVGLDQVSCQVPCRPKLAVRRTERTRELHP